MSWTPESEAAATEHVLALARRLRVEVCWEPEMERWAAHPGTRQVWVPAPVGAVEYLVALHELGHVGSLTARRWFLNGQYPALGVEALVEGAAWSWAAMMADPALAALATAEDWGRVFALLGEYLRYAAAQEAPPAKERARI